MAQMNAPDRAANGQPQLQQSPVHSQPLNTVGIRLDANHVDPAWNNHSGPLPVISAAGSPSGQSMNLSSHNWNGPPYYTGSDEPAVHSMQQPQQPLQTHHPRQPAAMLYSVDVEKQRKAEKIRNNLKEGCIDGCRFALSACACMACVGSVCCALTMNAS